MKDKENLVLKCLQQIIADCEAKDYGALTDLLWLAKKEVLEAFLSKE